MYRRTYYLRGDHLGSTSVVLDNAGAVYSRRTYYPYGEARTQQGSALPTDFTFTGQRFDLGELMDYGAREYDFLHVQFLQPDSIVPNPMDPQSLNRYAYVRNNPVNRIDPTGNADCAPEDEHCWKDRYFRAHGQCYSEMSQQWTRSCEPSYKDTNILVEVLQERGSDPAQLVLGIVDAIARGQLNNVEPNVVVLGLQFQGGSGLYGAVFGQAVFDYKHNQIGLFYGGEFGLIGPNGAGISYGLGIGWGGKNFTSVDSYSAYAFGAGMSGTAPVFGAFGIGFGGDVIMSAAEFSNGQGNGSLMPDPNNLIMVQPSLGIGSIGGEVHAYTSYAIQGATFSYQNDYAMRVATITTVYSFTHDIFLASKMGEYVQEVNEVPIGQ